MSPWSWSETCDPCTSVIKPDDYASSWTPSADGPGPGDDPSNEGYAEVAREGKIVRIGDG